MFTQCICNVMYKNTEPKEWRLFITGDGTWVTLALSALYQSSLLNQSVAHNYLMTPVKMSLSLAQLLVSVWQKYQHTWVFFAKLQASTSAWERASAGEIWERFMGQNRKSRTADFHSYYPCHGTWNVRGYHCGTSDGIDEKKVS